MAGLPWQIIIPIAFSLLSSQGIFGGGDRREEEDIRRADWERLLRRLKSTQYVDPNFARTVLQALMNRMGRTSGWGWPAGMGQDLSFLNIPGLMTPGKGEERTYYRG